MPKSNHNKISSRPWSANHNKPTTSIQFVSSMRSKNNEILSSNIQSKTTNILPPAQQSKSKSISSLKKDDNNTLKENKDNIKNETELLNVTELNHNARKLTTKFESEVVTTKNFLRRIKNSEILLEKQMKSSRLADALVKIKHECRALLSMLLELTHSHTKHIPRHNSIISLKTKRSEFHVENASDLELFEEKFGDLEETQLEDRLEMLVDLLTIRDDTILQLCMLLIESVSASLISHPSLLDHCPRHVGKLMTVLYTFRGLERALWKVELSRDQEKSAERLILLQSRVESQDYQIQDTEHRLELLKAEHQSLSTDHGKQLVFLRLQTKVEAQDKVIKSLEKETDQLRRTQFELIQSKGCLKDRLHRAEQELEAVRTAYKRDLASIRPMVEQQAERLEDNIRAMKVLSRNCELSALREESVVTAWDGTKNEVEILRNRLRNIVSELQMEQRRNERLEQEAKKKERISYVVAAAEVAQREEVERLSRELEISKETVTEQGYKLGEFQERNRHIQRLLVEEEAKVSRLSESESALRERLSIMQVEFAAQEVTLTCQMEEIHRLRTLRKQFVVLDSQVAESLNGPAAGLKSSESTARLRDTAAKELNKMILPKDMGTAPMKLHRPLSAAETSSHRNKKNASKPGDDAERFYKPIENE